MRSLRRLVLPTAIAVATALTLGGPASAAVVESAAPSVPAATVSAGHPATTASAENFETALYFYKKIDEGKRAAWKNSGKQYLVTTWEGKDFRTTLDAALLDDVEGVGEICGAGWGVQQDVVDLHKADGEDFTFPANITFPKDNIGWPPIVDADHWDLEELVEVPECGSELPAAPTVSVAPPSCESLSNEVTFTDLATDTRLVLGDLRIRAEDIPDGTFTYEQALADIDLAPAYGDITLDVLWYDRAGDKKDHDLGDLTLTLTEPSLVDCDTRAEATPVAPQIADCAAEMPGVVLPDTDAFVYTFDTDTRVATATVQDSFKAVPGNGWEATDVEGVLTQTVDGVPNLDQVCPTEPTLAGSVATGTCVADAPWLEYTVVVDDPDDQYTGDKTGTITFVAPEGEENVVETIQLDENLSASGSVLWPGASVDSEGSANGWPGWEQDADGTWAETTGNYAWARDLTHVTIDVNPSLTVDVSYPEATPECAAEPTVVEPTTEPTTTPTTAEPTTSAPATVEPTDDADDTEVLGASVPPEDGLAETGADALVWALVALGLIGGGTAAVLIARRRRA
ncbi:hypothetical protein SAMN04489860_2427 [Paraoerskovia marina]|uniref:Gram-positive cocci surface proteins LPxTG domain-containing protein n=1 Tax=Paraoerskovia marina TaxID=545619 RepID=A0A1H1V8P4_9CELL|nr:hypothetical protein [Paraoerskovia marina]SDS81108.1 hypothetical protein SAMN04489860_2427 [Paraoerskovia marina]